MKILTENLESFTAPELTFLHTLGARVGWHRVEFARRSAQDFDVEITGTMWTMVGPERREQRFSAWLPLAAIHALPSWKRAWEMCDIPEMAGEWSAIRDSSVETIWKMFAALCLAPAPRRR